MTKDAIARRSSCWKRPVPPTATGGVQAQLRNRQPLADRSSCPQCLRKRPFVEIVEFAAHRQRFLAEQGYAYRIMDSEDLIHP